MSLMRLNWLWVSACQRKVTIPGSAAGASIPWIRPGHTRSTIHIPGLGRESTGNGIKHLDMMVFFHYWRAQILLTYLFSRDTDSKERLRFPTNMTERYEAGWGRDADRKLCFLHTESICPFLMDMCYYCKRSLGDIPLQSVRGCWWWRPAHPTRPRGAPPQLAWPSQGALPASVTWACRCSTIHLWEATQQSVKLTPHKLRTNAGRTHPPRNI